MQLLIPVKDENFLYRDETGAIRNRDSDSYKKYIEHREKLMRDNERITNLESDVSSIKSSIDMILQLLQGVKE